MRVSDILHAGGVTVSCELFPPKHGAGLDDAKTVVCETAALNPSFISITHGAGGGTSSSTISLAREAQDTGGVTALAHLTCVSSSLETVRNSLEEMKRYGIENILALRGDIPPGAPFPLTGDFRFARDLVEVIMKSGDFCVGGACYPEGHPESPTLDEDFENLKTKADCGCSFFVTQMFFDNNILYNFMFRLLKKGIHIPVVAGIMPVTNGRQIARICKLSGTALPPRFKAITDKFADNPAAMNQAGVAYATEQIIDLVANGVNHIHIYTMNKPDIAGRIMQNLSEILK